MGPLLHCLRTDTGGWLVIRFNLIPYREFGLKKRRQQFGVQAAAVALLTGGVLLAATQWVDDQFALQQLRNERLSQEEGRLTAEIREVTRIEKEVQALVTRINTIASLDTDRTLATQLINDLAQTQPLEVSLDQVVIKQSSLELSGKTSSNEKLSTWLLALEKQMALRGLFLKIVKQDMPVLPAGNPAAGQTALPVAPKSFSILATLNRKGPDLTVNPSTFDVKAPLPR